MTDPKEKQKKWQNVRVSLSSTSLYRKSKMPESLFLVNLNIARTTSRAVWWRGPGLISLSMFSQTSMLTDYHFWIIKGQKPKWIFWGSHKLVIFLHITLLSDSISVHTTVKLHRPKALGKVVLHQNRVSNEWKLTSLGKMSFESFLLEILLNAFINALPY